MELSQLTAIFVIRILLEKDDDRWKGVMALLPFWWIPTLIRLKIFQNADKAARRLICTDIERKPLELVLSCTTAREMWLKSSSVYDLKSNENLELM